MKRTYTFATAREVVRCVIDGVSVDLPLIVGVLKHPTEGQLRELLVTPAIARKYTREALKRLAWPGLRQFPRDWLRVCLDETPLPEGRRRALVFMLGG